MALQVTKTNGNGLTVSYWRVKNIDFQYDESWRHEPSGQLFRANIAGYHNAEYRTKEAQVELHQYAITGSSLTNIISTTSGDLRPGIYDYLKSTGADGSGIATIESALSGGEKLGQNFFINATDI